MSKRSFYIIIFYVLYPLSPFPKIRLASYFKGSGVAYIIIIFVIKVVSTSVINHFLANAADLSFLA
jgi:hypothetical protein